MELEYNEFPELVKLLDSELTTDSKHTDTLRGEMAEAETWGIMLAQYVRTLEQAVDDEVNGAFRSLQAHPPEGIKLTVDREKIMLDADTSEVRAKLKYAKELQELIKRRCLLGQSFLNSMNVERSTSNFS